MTSHQSIHVEQHGSVAWVWLSRPEVHNAFDADLIAELTATLQALERNDNVRIIVLAGQGRSFSAGAQVQWMQKQGAATREENSSDAERLAALFKLLAEFPKPTIARVHGAALGGGVGLVCACDIAIGSSAASFGTTEVRLGLIPATIAPYVLRAIGERQARRLFQTGERIKATEAQRIGLLHVVTEPETLDEGVSEVIRALLAGAPGAQRVAKKLIAALAEIPLSEEVLTRTVREIVEQRTRPEAREGLQAFLEKREPSWATKV